MIYRLFLCSSVGDKYFYVVSFKFLIYSWLIIPTFSQFATYLTKDSMVLNQRVRLLRVVSDYQPSCVFQRTHHTKPVACHQKPRLKCCVCAARSLLEPIWSGVKPHERVCPYPSARIPIPLYSFFLDFFIPASFPPLLLED